LNEVFFLVQALFNPTKLEVENLSTESNCFPGRNKKDWKKRGKEVKFLIVLPAFGTQGGNFF